MNKQDRKQVKDYLSRRNVNSMPLHFNSNVKRGSRKIPPVDIMSKMSIPDLIQEILRLCSHYSTDNANATYYTRSEAARSSGDIWLLCRTYKPRISIFSVIRAIYKMQDNLYGSYCDMVQKRVFIFSSGSGVTDKLENDEYGLTFYDWESI